MSSRQIEDLHRTLLDKLISDSGLECLRSAPESIESFILSRESEEQEQVKEEEEAASETRQEEEEKPEIVEQVPVELPYVFPTPSLRRVISEKVREIEQQNRISVLPEKFNTDIDPQAIPKIASTAQQKYIEILGEIVGCKNYTSSLAEYWFLDTLANLLWRAQDDEVDRPTQAILIQWFCEWMKEMQHFDAAERQRMMRRFKDNMLCAASVIAEENILPAPQDCGVFYKAQEEPEMQDSAVGARTTDKSKVSMATTGVSTDPKNLVTFEGTGYECALRDLTKIIHYIFDLFSTDYQYNLVRSVFTFSPDYVRIDVPFQMQNPRRLYAPLKPTKPKKESKSPKKDPAKGKHKGKKQEVLPEEYIALMQQRLRDLKQQEEEEERDREAYNRRSHILPLVQATDEHFLDKYWPPPPPEPELEPKPQRKGKKKK